MGGWIYCRDRLPLSDQNMLPFSIPGLAYASKTCIVGILFANGIKRVGLGVYIGSNGRPGRWETITGDENDPADGNVFAWMPCPQLPEV